MTTQRKLTRTDVAMILELRSSGVRLGFIAHYVYSTTYHNLYHQLKTWGALTAAPSNQSLLNQRYSPAAHVTSNTSSGGGYIKRPTSLDS